MDDLLSQLKTIPKESKRVLKNKNKPLHKNNNNLEKFVIEKASKLIEESLDIISNMKDVVLTTPDPENISTVSDIIKASTGAIEVLNKLVLEDKKSKTQLESKQLSLSHSNNRESSVKIMLSREEVMDQININKDVVDINPENDKKETKQLRQAS